MLTDTQNGAVRIFVSHNRWKPEEACYVLRVSTLTTTIEALESGADSDWETLYESRPCRPVELDGEPYFGGLESGGRMALTDANTLLLNDGYSGFWREQTAQNLDQTNGKSWLIDIETGKTELFSYGHRNHQGLHIDRANNIWATEHGPQGGDELNLLKRGSNYGWPFVSFGTQYGSFEWEMSEQQNKHEGYEQPVYAWVPSIGVSNLIRLGGEQFPAWEGNLLVTSLQDGTIYRLVIVENRVVVAEPMLLGPRLRDLLEMPDGRILLWTDEASIMVLANADTSDSDAALFAAMCSSCHAIDDTRRSGPNLETAYGRDIGDLRAYEYSNALDNRSGKWNRETLDAFLSNPQGFVPGTAMVIEPVTDPKTRKRLIDYLEDL
jgi:cytochrome c2